VTDRGSPTTEPLVLHVIPTPVARGAQREARALADELDDPGVRRHRVLSLFAGPPEVVPDYSLGFPSGARPASAFDPRLVLPLRTALGRYGPKVVIAHGGDALKYLVPAMVGRHQALVYYAIGTYSGPLERRYQVQLWRWLAARATIVAACGEEVFEEAVRLLNVPREKMALIFNGRDPDVFHPDPSPTRSGDPIVLFVGALTAGKRPGRFIDVVAGLRARGVGLRAQMVGDGPLRDELGDPAKRAGVEMLGHQSDVAGLMAGADVLVFPSLPSGEGMPGVLIEAGLVGLPVVATAVPGVSTIVEDGRTGLIVGLEDVSAMQDAITRLLSNSELRQRFGDAARRHCTAHFSMAAVGKRWLAMLQPLLDT